MTASEQNNFGATPRRSDELATQPERGSRRVLVVGDDLAPRLEPMVRACLAGASVSHVPSFLYAMGEASRRRVDAVIGGAAQLVGMGESAARCLREMLPEARLLVVSDERGRDEADAAVRGGFDARLDEPLEEAALRRALGDESAGVAGMVDAAAGVLRQHAKPQPPQEPSAADEANEALHADAASATTADESEPPDESLGRERLSDESLGDVDLIEALLTARDCLERRALEMVQQHSGIPQLAWTPSEETLPEDNACAVVCYRRYNYGLLHAPAPATAEQLAPWAAWMGRWLALNDQMRQLEHLALMDELTGAWNRRYFNRFLERILEQAQHDRSQVTVLVFDIDDFKVYNDRYGHAAGDEILRESARLMRSFVREHDVVARIGGDEFAVIFWDAEEKRRPHSEHPQIMRNAAQRFQRAIHEHRFPKLLDEAPGTLTISGGLASFPWDGRTPDELLERADAMAMQSKRQGKNAITFGPGAERACNGDT